MEEVHYLENIRAEIIRDTIKKKLFYAKEIGIKVCIDLVDEIKDFNISKNEAIEILEILLDNAIEAASESPKGIIKFGIIQEEKNIMIIVANSFKYKIPIFKMYKEGFTTKENKNGVGLNKLKIILERYQNVILDTIINSDEVTQIITVE